jgi:voltage-gated potassium channel
MAKPHRVLFTRTDTTPEQALLIRVSIVIVLLVMVVSVLWLDRGGLKDAADGQISFVDVVYFAVVTMTTVGYGDIVPVTDRARLIDAFYITPIRIFVWFIFLGSAYQFVFQKFLEDYRMAKLEQRLTGHMIICGYGHTGRVAAHELIGKGTPPDQIVAIDTGSEPVEAAAAAGLPALKGDAAKEELLQKVGLDKAQAVLVSPGRDDTAVLIVLTVRQLNRSVRIIASANEEENVKLLKQAGADVIVSPSTVGGYMMAKGVASTSSNAWPLPKKSATPAPCSPTDSLPGSTEVRRKPSASGNWSRSRCKPGICW